MTEIKSLQRYVIPLLIAAGIVCLTGNGQEVGKPKPPPPSGINQQPSGHQDDIIEIDTRLVNVPVSVMDREGRFIADLRREEFQLFEEGVEQEIAFFAPVESAFNVVLLIDTSPSTRPRQKEIRAAAVSFVDQLRPEDNVMVVSFSGNIRVLSSATRDRKALRKAIDELRWVGGGTLLYGTVEALMSGFFRRLRGRKALVMLTDGLDTDARLRPNNFYEKWTFGATCKEIPCATYESNMRDAEELDTLIYPIMFGPGIPQSGLADQSRLGVTLDPPTLSPSAEENRLGELYLRELAVKTGGRFYNSEKGEDLTVVFNSIANDLRYQYSLGYYVKIQLNPGDRRRIKVSVTRPNLAVRAKPSYIVAQRRAKAPRIRSSNTP